MERDACRHDVERVVQDAPEADVLGDDHAEVDEAKRRPDADDLRDVEEEPADDRGAEAEQRELRDAREPHLAAHVEEPLGAAMVLGRDRELRLRPDPAIDLEVPAVPARVDRDQVLARDEEVHERREERLLLVALLAPVADREAAPQIVDARRLLLALEGGAPHLAEPPEPPEVALDSPDERSEVGEERDQGARRGTGEARVDARAGGRRDGEPERHDERQRADDERARRHERREKEENPDGVPLEREREVPEERRRRLVERLEEPAPEGAEIDDGPAREDGGGELAVDATEPARLSEQIEPIRMLEIEERLGLAVPHLLLQVRLHRVPAVVPDGGRGAEADRVPLVLEAPAEVHVVAGSREHRVEPADVLERLLREPHVATRD